MTRYPIKPVPKPRMTRRDQWTRRASVQRYWDFKDAVTDAGIILPAYGSHVTFEVPMPESASKAERARLEGMGHTKRPDLDNLAKALFDALFDEDSHIWDIRITKRWADVGGILIEENTPCN